MLSVFFFPCPQPPLMYFLWICLRQTFHTNGSIRCVAICDRLLSLSSGVFALGSQMRDSQSRSWKSKSEVSTALVSPEAFLRGLQTAGFSLCSNTAFSFFVHLHDLFKGHLGCSVYISTSFLMSIFDVISNSYMGISDCNLQIIELLGWKEF